MKKNKYKEQLLFWRILTYFWGMLTAVFFIINFFHIVDYSHSLKTLVIVYISVLSIFTSVKEFQRWKTKKFLSKYRGEIFVIGYTILMIIFIFLNARNPMTYNIPKEFTATYLSILGIFAISYNSKYLKNK